jgi:glycosyltransferase involved in cell wall biosynthesis
MIEISVIICAHNPRPAYLVRVLEALRTQSLPKERWELLLIDNGSQTRLSAAWDLSWHPAGRHLVEAELGLAPARRRGMAEASGDILVFVDDDNVLASDYLSEVIRIKRDWPSLGTWGSGAIIPEFELEPKRHLDKLVPNLALREVGTPRWTNVVPCSEATPWGAGLCVRASVATAYRKFCERSTIQISGRQGKILLSGEDVEISYTACELGFGIGIFPQLKVMHLIPKERVEPAYLLRIFEGIGISNWLIAYKWEGVKPWSPLSPRGLISILKNAVLRHGIERRMYFAGVRAAVRARKIITASQRS